MKRRIRLDTETGVVFPKEVLGELARWVSVKSVVNIYAFILICKTTLDSLPLLIERWALSYDHGLNLSSEADLLRKWMGNRFLTKNMILKSQEVNELLFRLQIYTLLGKNWLRLPSGIFRCMRFGGSESSKLGDLFFYDKLTKKAIPVVDLPCLKVVEIPSNLTSSVMNLITEIQGEDDVIGNAAKKTAARTDYGELIIMYYRLMKRVKRYCLVEPLDDDPVISAVVGDINFIKDLSIADNLYYCNYERELGCKNHVQCKTRMVELHMLYHDTMDEIEKKLKSFSPLLPSSSSSSSDDSSDSDDTDTSDDYSSSSG